MLNEFITVLIIEISKILLSHKDFFELSEESRLKLSEVSNLDPSFQKYLSQVKDDELMLDFQNLTRYIHNNSISIENNKLAQAVAQFLIEDFSKTIYSIPVSYFKLSYKEQDEFLNKLINQNNLFFSSLKSILLHNSYQEVLNEIYNFVNKLYNSPLVIVQSPVEVDTETKKEIQDKLNQHFDKPCLPSFQINKNLIGGLRLFIDGSVTDLSWLARINLITALK